MQLELAEDVRFLSSMVTHDGVFQWRSLPFGLAPCRTVSVLTSYTPNTEGIAMEGCCNILDDILVYKRDMNEHDKRLKAVLYTSLFRP
jgi:hypothetical protein